MRLCSVYLNNLAWYQSVHRADIRLLIKWIRPAVYQAS